jgi:hypothetical protein
VRRWHVRYGKEKPHVRESREFERKDVRESVGVEVSVMATLQNGKRLVERE